ncbi:MAG: hypothetical protein M3Y71_14970 [Actinomycetota bacterium]|nr:hypothetical protein [Actinomycetota bacterium]
MPRVASGLRGMICSLWGPIDYTILAGSAIPAGESSWSSVFVSPKPCPLTGR